MKPCAPLLASLLAGACATAAAPAKRVRAPRADVIVISVDTLRADHVGAWGAADAQTPTFDALAASGARFDAAVTPVPRTTPGLGTLWTGLAPHEHGSREVGHPLRSGVLLSERLEAQGWGTAAVSANEAASPRQGLGAGFDRFELRAHADASVVTDVAIELADGVPPSQPLLLWAHYLDPHSPYRAPPEANPPATPRCDRANRSDAAERLIDLDSVASRAREECLEAYDAEIAWADRHVARLLAHLEAAGRLRKAFVVFTSDHGEAFGERGLWYAHGPHVHHSALHVPLAIAGPGIAPGQVVDAAVGLSDVAPTLLGLLGLEVPDDLDGASLAAWLLDGATPEPRLRFAESASAMVATFDGVLLAGVLLPRQCVHGPRFTLCWTRDYETPPTLFDRATDPLLESDVAAEHPDAVRHLSVARRRWVHSAGREHAVFDGRYALLERPRLEGGFTYALYDVSVDPGETRDLSEAHPDVARRLREGLDRWAEGVPNSRPAAIDEETQRQLRALGYVR